jgi:hypothetical protein
MSIQQCMRCRMATEQKRNYLEEVFSLETFTRRN